MVPTGAEDYNLMPRKMNEQYDVMHTSIWASERPIFIVVVVVLFCFGFVMYERRFFFSLACAATLSSFLCLVLFSFASLNGQVNSG